MEQFQRITSAAVIIPPLVLFLYYAPQALFLVLVLTVVSLSMREYFYMLSLAQLPVRARTSYAVAFLFVLTAYTGGNHWMPVALFFGVVILTVSVMLPPQNSIPHRFLALLHSLFGVFFIGWSLSHLVLLRSLTAGKWLIFFLCVIVWVGDSTAMYIGKSLGRYKIAPTISPGKTWEGAAGGMLGCVLAAALGARVFASPFGLWQSLTLGLMISIAAQISDLSESMVKRYARVKDSGELIPGHGGLLDRIDSILFAAPVFLYALDVLRQIPSP